MVGFGCEYRLPFGESNLQLEFLGDGNRVWSTCLLKLLPYPPSPPHCIEPCCVCVCVCVCARVRACMRVCRRQ